MCITISCMDETWNANEYQSEGGLYKHKNHLGATAREQYIIDDLALAAVWRELSTAPRAPFCYHPPDHSHPSEKHQLGRAPPNGWPSMTGDPIPHFARRHHALPPQRPLLPERPPHTARSRRDASFSACVNHRTRRMGRPRRGIRTWSLSERQLKR